MEALRGGIIGKPCGDQAAAAPREVDPYEATRVSEAASRIPGAGTGLFARRSLAAGEVAAFLAGRLLEDEGAEVEEAEEAEEVGEGAASAWQRGME